MIYNNLAKYYDALLKDDDAVLMWTSFFNKHKYGNTILELASGTGEITLELAKDYTIDATDLSEEMLEQLKQKDENHIINKLYQLDMKDLNIENHYDNVICFCDSINYLNHIDDVEKLIKDVYSILNDKGVFMFDMHTHDRLVEFEEPFIETGQLLDTDYQWTIISDDDKIYHHFVFYEDEMLQEYHTQTVFNTHKVIELMKNQGFKTTVYTDFTTDGITEGEKIFIVGEKI